MPPPLKNMLPFADANRQGGANLPGLPQRPLAKPAPRPLLESESVQNLALKYLAEGMVVAKPVSNDKGMVLLAAGTELTASLIERIEKMKVTRVAVEGHPVDLPGQESMSPEERLAQLDQAFSRVTEEPHMMALKEVFVDYVNNPPGSEDEPQDALVEGEDATPDSEDATSDIEPSAE